MDEGLEKLYSPEEVADFLKLKVTTVYKYISSRRIANIKLGNRVLIPESALKEYIEEYGTLREAE